MSLTLPPGVHERTARNIVTKTIDEWGASGTLYRDELTNTVSSTINDLLHATSPAKVVKKTLRKLEDFFGHKEIRGRIFDRNPRRIQFDVIFPSKTEGGLSFHFLSGEINGRSGAHRLTESQPVQISTHALQRLLERLSSRSDIAALDEIYAGMQLATTWNTAGLSCGAQCWPIMSNQGFFVAAPDKESKSAILITWMKNEQLSRKWASVSSNIRLLEQHHPELMIDTTFVETFISSFPWMRKKHVPGMDMETLAWNTRIGHIGAEQSFEETTIKAGLSNDENEKQSISYLTGLNYQAPPSFRPCSQHRGVVVQKVEPGTLIISLMNGYFGTLDRIHQQVYELKDLSLEDINVGDQIDVEVTRITHYKSENAYAVEVITRGVAEYYRSTFQSEYPIGYQAEGVVVGINGSDYVVRLSERVFGFVSQRRLNWWLNHREGSVTSAIRKRVEFVICGYRVDKRRLLLDMPNFEQEYNFALAEKVPIGQFVEGTICYVSDNYSFLSLDIGFEALLRKINCWGMPLPKLGERVVVQVLLANTFEDRILVGLPPPGNADRSFAPLPLTEMHSGQILQNHFVGENVRVQIINCSLSGYWASMSDGAVGFLPYKEIDWSRNPVKQELGYAIGDLLEVQIVKINIAKRKIRFSRRIILPHPLENPEFSLAEGLEYEGTIVKTFDFGYFVLLKVGVTGLLHKNNIPKSLTFQKGETIKVFVSKIDSENKRIALSFSHHKV